MSENRTVHAYNLTPEDTEAVVRELFGFAGEIDALEIKDDAKHEGAKFAAVTFKLPGTVSTALLLHQAVVKDREIAVTLPPGAKLPSEENEVASDNERGHGATGAVAGALAGGWILADGVADRAKAYDEKHYITLKAKIGASAASHKLKQIDEQYKISKTMNDAERKVSGKIVELDQKFKVSETVTSTAKQMDEKFKIKETTKNAVESLKSSSAYGALRDLGSKAKAKANELGEETKQRHDEKRASMECKGSQHRRSSKDAKASS